MARYRAAAIGRTGRGDYGHDIDLAWSEQPDVSLVAVADEDAAGLRAALARTGAAEGYADYRELLARERPDFVSVCPRWPDCHAEMLLACAEAGVKGVLCEKPFAPTLAEADAALAACERAGTRVAVAHQSRVMPQVRDAVHRIRAGALGQVQTLVGHGKCDARGGGEDLIVLGSHILDLMRQIAGDPEWVCARVSSGGREMALPDARAGAEGLGLLAGDGLAALYAFPEGVTGSFDSYRNPAGGSRFGLEVYGTGGMAAFRAGEGWQVRLLPGARFPNALAEEWITVPASEWEEAPRRLLWCNRLLARDLIAAVEDRREPICSGDDGRWTIEMALGVYTSHLSGCRTRLPLADRAHPLDDEGRHPKGPAF